MKEPGCVLACHPRTRLTRRFGQMFAVKARGTKFMTTSSKRGAAEGGSINRAVIGPGSAGGSIDPGAGRAHLCTSGFPHRKFIQRGNGRETELLPRARRSSTFRWFSVSEDRHSPLPLQVWRGSALPHLRPSGVEFPVFYHRISY